jgi:hypothetical protein
LPTRHIPFLSVSYTTVYAASSDAGGSVRSRRRPTAPGSAPPAGSEASAKAGDFGRLGWNSYGTEGAKPVANVSLSEGRKWA